MEILLILIVVCAGIGFIISKKKPTEEKFDSEEWDKL